MDALEKKKLSERDICTKFITPAITQLRLGPSSPDPGRGECHQRPGTCQGQLRERGKPRRADYILYYKPNLPIAVIEAKDNNHIVGAGMQQALAYAEMMDIPFVFSSNGDGFLLHDRSGSYEPMEQELSLTEFPSSRGSLDPVPEMEGAR